MNRRNRRLCLFAVFFLLLVGCAARPISIEGPRYLPFHYTFTSYLDRDFVFDLAAIRSGSAKLVLYGKHSYNVQYNSGRAPSSAGSILDVCREVDVNQNTCIEAFEVLQAKRRLLDEAAREAGL